MVAPRARRPRRPPHAVADRAGGWTAAPARSRAARLHRARPDPAPHGGKRGLWRSLFGRFERVVVHSERGRETLAAFGVAGGEAPRDPGPALRRATRRAPTTAPPCSPSASSVRTSRSITLPRRCGVSRGARLLVAGDPRGPVAAAFDGAEDFDSATSPTRRCSAHSGTRPSPSFRTAPRSTSRRRSCRRSAPASRPWSTTSAASPDPVREFGAGRVVAPDDVEALAAAIQELLGDPAALEAARAGARRAREMTWDGSAAAHLELYRELV